MLTAALTRARRLAPQFFVCATYRTAPILEVVAECEECELSFTAGQFAALPPAGILTLHDGTDFVAARRCRCGGIVVAS